MQNRCTHARSAHPAAESVDVVLACEHLANSVVFLGAHACNCPLKLRLKGCEDVRVQGPERAPVRPVDLEPVVRGVGSPARLAKLQLKRCRLGLSQAPLLVGLPQRLSEAL